MAAPVITSVTPSSATLAPGESVTFTVAASDADSGAFQVTVVITDPQGNQSQTATVPVTFQNPLALSVAPPAGFPGTITTSGLTFTVTAP